MSQSEHTPNRPSKDTSSLRIAFMGSPEFAVPGLHMLYEQGFEIVCVYSQPPRPAGRGKKLQKTAIHQAAEALDLPIKTPSSFKEEIALAEFKALDLDLVIVVAYGLLLPQSILEIPRLGCLNIHASLLPRWRGAAPIHRAIQAGDAETGVTIMKMVPALDAGPILSQEIVALSDAMTALQLQDILSYRGASLLVKTLPAYVKDMILPQDQDENLVTYAGKLQKQEAMIDWRQSADQIYRKFRAFSPWPGISFIYQGEIIKIKEVCVEYASGPPGTVLDEALLIACGENALRLICLQRPGRKSVIAKQFLQNWSLPKGSILE